MGDYPLPVIRGHVDLAPGYPGAAFLGRSVIPIVASWRGRGQPVRVVVGGHGADDFGGGQQVFGVHVAPPEDGLDAAHEWQPPMQPRHVTEPGVDAPDGVVGGEPFAAVLCCISPNVDGPPAHQLAGPRLALRRRSCTQAFLPSLTVSSFRSLSHSTRHALHPKSRVAAGPAPLASLSLSATPGSLQRNRCGYHQPCRRVPQQP